MNITLLPAKANVKDVLSRLIPLVNKASHDEWREKISGWSRIYPKMYDDKPADSINPKFICECLLFSEKMI